MRASIAMILGFVLLASPVRSAMDAPPPGETEIEARIKAVQKQQQQLRIEEERLRKELAEAKTRSIGGIKSEVSGILKRNESGHYIVFRADGGKETRVWLKPSDKQVYLQLAKLIDKEVVASGPLLQKPQVVPNLFLSSASPQIPTIPQPDEIKPTMVPEHGMYLEQFKIEEFVPLVK